MPRHLQRIALVVTLLTCETARAQAPQQPSAYSRPPAARPSQVGPVQGGPVQGGAGLKQPANVAPGGPQSPRVAQAPGKEGAPPTKPPGPVAPFVLSPAQEKLLDTELNAWEERSAKIKTFKCRFSRWDYDGTFGNVAKQYLKAEGVGEIRYKSPDHGVYRVSALKEWNEEKKAYGPKPDGLDHWVCDGKAIFEFAVERKTLIEHKLPPELQGKAIADGPLPFIFNAEAKKLKQRYFLRDVTPKEAVGKQIWLEAYPKYQRDAANFQRVEFILTDNDFQPYALQIFLPGGSNRTVYMFDDIRVNGLLDALDFLPPRTPLGWKYEVDDPSAEQAPTKTPPADASQARRPTNGPARK